MYFRRHCITCASWREKTTENFVKTLEFEYSAHILLQIIATKLVFAGKGGTRYLQKTATPYDESSENQTIRAGIEIYLKIRYNILPT